MAGKQNICYLLFKIPLHFLARIPLTRPRCITHVLSLICLLLNCVKDTHTCFEESANEAVCRNIL